MSCCSTSPESAGVGAYGLRRGNIADYLFYQLTFNFCTHVFLRYKSAPVAQRAMAVVEVSAPSEEGALKETMRMLAYFN